MIDLRRSRAYVAVAVCGGTAFVDMYATQPLLPDFLTAFHASHAHVAQTVSALTLAVAFTAPFVGPAADAIGRKSVIVGSILALAAATFAASFAGGLGELIFWRVVQGVAMPGVFATTLAYVAEEFEPAVAGRAVGAYIGGNVFGGFLGRFVSAAVAARSDWHVAFVALGALNLAGAACVVALLPPARNFRRRKSLRGALAAMRRFVTDPTLLATYAVGGCALFALVAAFTFATFRFAAVPFSLSTDLLGDIFAVYLAGVVAAPLSGRLIDRFGNKATVLLGLGIGAGGMLLTLPVYLPTAIAGLGCMSTGVFITQASSQGAVGRIAGSDRSTAASLYLSVYYGGASLGAVAPAYTWTHGGWPPTVALVVGVLALAAVLAATWRDLGPVAARVATEPRARALEAGTTAGSAR